MGTEEGKKSKDGKKKGKNRRRFTGWRAAHGEFWKPGTPLTKEDQVMLDVVRRVYERQGYSPTRGEVPNSSGLKKRFRIWGDVLAACGYPQVGDAGEMKKRREATLWKKRMKEIMNGAECGKTE